MTTYEELRRKKAGHKGSLTYYTKDIDLFLQTASEADRVARLRSLEIQVDKYGEVSELMAPLFSSDELYFKENMEDTIFLEGVEVIIATIKQQAKDVTKNKKDSRTDEKKRSGVKLPHLTLPTFAGDSTLWNGFWDMFNCSIHNNPDLDDIQKFTYLKGQLRNDAYKLIDGFTVEGASYKSAISLLEDTYGHPDRIKAAHILKFNELRSPHCQVEELQTFHANMESAIRSFRSLKVSLEEYCVVTLLHKLPSPVREVVRREMGDKGLNYDKLTQCLLAEIYNMGTHNTYKASASPPSSTATFTTTQGGNRSFSCLLCDGSNHYWYKCFKHKTAALKVKRAKQLRLCTGCLASEHGSKGCTNPIVKSCKFCRGKHFHSLCTKPRQETKPASGSPRLEKANTTSTMAVNTDKNTVILPTVQLPVKGKETKIIKIRSLLDQCSQRSFVKSSLLSSLSYDTLRSEDICLHGFTGKQASRSYQVVELRYLHRGRRRRLEAIVVDELPEHQVGTSFNTQVTGLRKKGIKLADPRLTETAQLGLLIGADHYYDIVRPGYKKSGDLILLPTIYGYAISGSYRNNASSSTTEVITVLKLAVTPTDQLMSTGQYPCHKELSCLWELDHIGIKPNEHTLAERTALSSYEDTVVYNSEEKQYQVRLPWNGLKDRLPTNKGLAVGRMRSLQKKFIAEPHLLTSYKAVISDQLARGFIEVAPLGVDDSCHYLAHHGVLKDSKTTPVRIVFDCSARLNNRSPSLNNCLYTGPSLVPDLTKVLMRFRVHRYAWVSDIEKAFLMLKLAEEDRDFTRFLWPADPQDLSSPLICYRFQVILFGATCSQFLLNATILKHLSLSNKDPAVIQELRAGLYIDNLQGTGDEEETLVGRYQIARDVFESAHLYLKQWATNSPMLSERLHVDGVGITGNVVKVLGLHWHTDSDKLAYGADITPSELVTKRECLRTTAKLFDPLGLLLPVTIKSRIFLQRLWRLKHDWDEELSLELKQEWDAIVRDMSKCRSVYFPRQVIFNNVVSIHAFSDASSTAYGAAVYVQDPVGCRLIMAKARVAPIKSLSIPKLELTAVLLSARLVKFVEEAYEDSLTISDITIWTDSQITLYWLHSAKKLPVYVTNRVDEIKLLIPTAIYRYVSTKDNPSDMISRGVSATTMVDSVLWWNGPAWLPNHDEWPVNISLQEPDTGIVTQVTHAVPQENTQSWDWDRFSSYEKLVRITAWMLRFINNVRAKTKGLPPTGSAHLNIKEIRNAGTTLVRICQQEHYSQEHKLLVRGAPTRHNLINQLGLHLKEDVIHCGGRLKYAAVSEICKAPILLPSKHRFTHLIVDRYHRLCCHYGVGHVVSSIRQRYWVPRIRQVVKGVLRKCLQCRRVQGKPYDYPGLPPLPALRTTPGEPYKCTGVDYSGAIPVKDSPLIKAYMILFTCAVSRAIHIEVVANLTCDSFLHAFRRFCSRQGFPQIIMSDNASTFVGASRYLEDICNHPKVRTHLNNINCEWRFIPARAPWFGAIWERAIGLVKSGLKKVLGRALLSLEELTTILLEIEAVVNDRPLYYASGDLEDPTPITPSMLIRGYRLRDLPDEIDVEAAIEDRDFRNKEVITSRFKYIRKLSQDIWRRWSHEYLVTLREAQKTKLRPIEGQWPKVGDVVTIHEEGPRVLWKLGRVTELLPGRDGEVRVARVRTKTGIISRPTAKLYPVESDLDEVVTQEENPGVVPTVGPVDPPDTNDAAASGRPRRQAAQTSTQGWRDKIASGLL